MVERWKLNYVNPRHVTFEMDVKNTCDVTVEPNPRHATLEMDVKNTCDVTVEPKARFILLTPSVSDKYCRRRLPPAAVAAVAESRWPD